MKIYRCYQRHDDPATCPCRELEAQAQALAAEAGLTVSAGLLDIDLHFPKHAERFNPVRAQLEAVRQLFALGWSNAALQALDSALREAHAVRSAIVREAWAETVEADRRQIEEGKPLSPAQAGYLKTLPGGGKVYKLALSRGLILGEDGALVTPAAGGAP